MRAANANRSSKINVQKTLDITVIGGAMWDVAVRADRLPGSGEDVSAFARYSGAGGKGANQARAAARLGGRVAFVGRIGDDDHGKQIRDSLLTDGVDCDHLKIDREAATGIALMHVDGQGNRQSSAEAGANRNVQTEDVLAAAPLIGASECVIVNLEIPLPAVITAVDLAAQSNCRIFLDPAPPADLPQAFLRSIHVLKPNRHEAERLTGLRVRSAADARDAARRLLELGIELVAIEAGGEGNLFKTADRGAVRSTL